MGMGIKLRLVNFSIPWRIYFLLILYVPSTAKQRHVGSVSWLKVPFTLPPPPSTVTFHLPGQLHQGREGEPQGQAHQARQIGLTGQAWGYVVLEVRPLGAAWRDEGAPGDG